HETRGFQAHLDRDSALPIREERGAVHSPRRRSATCDRDCAVAGPSWTRAGRVAGQGSAVAPPADLRVRGYDRRVEATHSGAAADASARSSASIAARTWS